MYMNNKFTTAYFESAKLYTEKYDFKYMDANESRDRMHVCFNINDPFFKPLGAEITSILEVNDDIAFNFYVFVDIRKKGGFIWVYVSEKA